MSNHKATDKTKGPSGTSAAAQASVIMHRLTLWQAIVFGVGVLGGMSGGAMNSLSLAIFNITLGVDAAKITLAMGIVQMTGLLLDPIIANFSDNLSSRWGRRRPLIVVGSIIAGIAFAILWMFPLGWSDNAYFAWYLTLSLIINFGQALYSSAYFALGIEVATDYKDRTRIMAIRSYFGKVVGLINPWLFFLAQISLFSSAIEGIRWIGALVGAVIIATAVPCAIFTHERLGLGAVREKKAMPHPLAPFINFFKTVVSIGNNRYFWMCLGVGITLTSGLMIFEGVGYYVNIYYVFGGNTYIGAQFGGLVNTLGTVLSILAIPFAQFLCNRLGKHITLRLALFWMLLGSVLKWWCYSPEHPYLIFVIPLFYSVGISSFWLILPAMQADVVDIDEYNSGKRREAMFGAVSNLGMRAAIAISITLLGLVLNSTGFSNERGNAVTLGSAELSQPQALLADIQSSKNEAVAYIGKKFAEDKWKDTTKSIQAYEQGLPLAKVLAEALNEVSMGRNIAAGARPDTSALPESIERLASKNPSGTELTILNTLVLHEIFPDRLNPLSTPLQATFPLRFSQTMKWIGARCNNGKVSFLQLDAKDIKDPHGLLSDLRNASHPGYTLFWSNMSDATKEKIIKEETGESLRVAMTKGLNKIICAGIELSKDKNWFRKMGELFTNPPYNSLYGEAAFKNSAGSESTRLLADSNPSGYAVGTLNRALMADALKAYLTPAPQEKQTFTRMRLMFSFAMATVILLSLLFVGKYDLTAERMEEVRIELERRRKAGGEQGS